MATNPRIFWSGVLTKRRSMKEELKESDDVVKISGESRE